MIAYPPLREKCLYTKFYWSTFSCIGTKCEDLLCKFTYLVQMRKNPDQENSEYRHLLRSVFLATFF